MKEYILQNNWGEITPEQISDPTLVIKVINKQISIYPIPNQPDHKCRIEITDCPRVTVVNMAVHVYGNSVIESYNNSIVYMNDNSIITAFETGNIHLSDNSIGHMYDNTKAYVRNNAKCMFFDRSHGEIWTSNCVSLHDNALVDVHSSASIKLFDYSSAILMWDRCSIKAYHNSTIISSLILDTYELFGNARYIRPDEQVTLEHWCKYNEPVTFINSKNILLYKKVSNDYKTQEKNEYETSWLPGTTVEMPMHQWEPRHAECGEGKFHACSMPSMCDRFRVIAEIESKLKDKYVAIKVHINDVYVWKHNPKYPEKIAFRKGKVLYECDINGKKLCQPII